MTLFSVQGIALALVAICAVVVVGFMVLRRLAGRPFALAAIGLGSIAVWAFLLASYPRFNDLPGWLAGGARSALLVVAVVALNRWWRAWSARVDAR